MASEEQPQIPWAARPPGARPIALLADSRLLFQPLCGGALLDRLLDALPARTPRAAYVGASNGDDPAFYALFESACDTVGLTRRRQIPTALAAADLEWIDRSDLVLLSGGDVVRGWRALQENGLRRILERRYREGALLIGVSAGAVQLGLGLLDEPSSEPAGNEPGAGAGGPKLVRTLGLLPHAIGAHDEAGDWRALAATVVRFGGHVRGYGLPFGGGLLAHPDGVLTPLGRGAVELVPGARQSLVASAENQIAPS